MEVRFPTQSAQCHSAHPAFCITTPNKQQPAGVSSALHSNMVYEWREGARQPSGFQVCDHLADFVICD